MSFLRIIKPCGSPPIKSPVLSPMMVLPLVAEEEPINRKVSSLILDCFEQEHLTHRFTTLEKKIIQFIISYTIYNFV